VTDRGDRGHRWEPAGPVNRYMYPFHEWSWIVAKKSIFFCTSTETKQNPKWVLIFCPSSQFWRRTVNTVVFNKESSIQKLNRILSEDSFFFVNLLNFGRTVNTVVFNKVNKESSTSPQWRNYYGLGCLVSWPVPANIYGKVGCVRVHEVTGLNRHIS